MSLVIAIKTKDGAMVLAADRLGIDGELYGNSQPIENFTKVLKFSNGAIGIVGDVGNAIRPLESAIADIEKNTEQDPIGIIYKNMRDFYAETWPKLDDPDRADIKIAVAYTYHNISRIYAMESNYFSPHIMSETHTILGMRDYSKKLFNKFWYSDMEIEQATELAVFLVMDTGRVEIKVGKGPPDVITVINGKAEKLSSLAVEKIADAANARIDEFAKVFRKSTSAPPA